jgi:hypothetical protein
MADQIRVNGNLQSWGSIILKLADERFHGFDKISYGDELLTEDAYGMGKHHAPRGRTAGKYVCERSVLGGPKDTIEALRTAIAALSASGTSYGVPEFEVVVQFVEAGQTPMTVELVRCRIVKDSSSHEEGETAMKDELEIKPMYIRRNGRTLFDSSEGTP